MANKQRESLKITLEIKNCVRRAEKIRSIRTANESFNWMELLSLQPTNVSSNRNAALHARSLGPPWGKT